MKLSRRISMGPPGSQGGHNLPSMQVARRKGALIALNMREQVAITAGKRRQAGMIKK